MSIDWSTVQACKECPPIRKMTTDEAVIFAEHMYSNDIELWFCGGCHHGQNEWTLGEMLWDELNEFPTTPCCHTEAAAALQKYNPPVYVKEGK